MVETGRQLKRGAGGSVGRVRAVRRSGADAIEVESGEGAGDRKRGGRMCRREKLRILRCFSDLSAPTRQF